MAAAGKFSSETERVSSISEQATAETAQAAQRQTQQLSHVLEGNAVRGVEQQIENRARESGFPQSTELRNEIRDIEQARNEPNPQNMDRAYEVFETQAPTEQKEEIARETANELKNELYPEIAMENVKKFLDRHFFEAKERKGEGSREDEFFRTVLNNMPDARERERFFSEKELSGLRNDVKPVEPKLPDYAKNDLFLSRIADRIASLTPEEKQKIEQRLRTISAVPRLK